MDIKLKELIFNKLYKRLGNAEIIPYNNSIWFIDREKEYWYFEFDTSGTLWWRYNFFTSFFEMFSITRDEFTPILSSWVEQVLNHKVSTTGNSGITWAAKVEEVLNHKVSTTPSMLDWQQQLVEEVLNHKVSTTAMMGAFLANEVEEVLNHKVTETQTGNALTLSFVKDVLNNN